MNAMTARGLTLAAVGAVSPAVSHIGKPPLQLWPVIVGIGCFVAAGGGIPGLQKAVAGTVSGVVWALLYVTVAGALGRQELVSALVLGVAVFGIVYQARIPLLSYTAGAIAGTGVALAYGTPAHLAIYASGIIAGLSCGWLVLKTTFAGSDAERAASVRFWGFRGPLGAWLCIWGAMAMIVSAPFDNWWHNAYGLDVKVLSPPHLILALGFTGIQLGAVLMVAALQNRAGGEARRGYGRLLAYGIGILVLNVAIMGFEQIGVSQTAHNALHYPVCAAVSPTLLAASARASSLRWTATA